MAKETALALVKTSARSLDATISSTQSLLVGFSELVNTAAPQTLDPAILGRVLAGAPLPLADLWILGADGRPLAFANERADGFATRTLATRALADSVTATRQFTIGRVFLERDTHGDRAIMPVAMPVINASSGTMVAVVGASILVDSLEPVREALSLPAGSVLTIMDSLGRVVYRTLDRKGWIGREFPVDGGLRLDLAVTERISVGKHSADGTIRLVARRRLAHAPWMMFLGIPQRVTMDVARNTFLRDLALVALLTLVVLGISYRLTIKVVEPIESLTDDAQAIAAGDMSRRSSHQSQDEVGDLARAFNRMADTIAARDASLKSSQERLFHSQKLEALGSFAGGFAHDFNNLLHSIIGHAELAAMGLPDDAIERQDLRQVISAAARAADLTRQILIFSQKQVVAPRVLDLSDTVAGIEAMLLRLIGDRRRLELLRPDDAVLVYADQGQLEQVIVNLVVNAHDATPETGVIVVAVDVSSSAATSNGDDASPDRMARLRVIDDGTGMPPDIRERVFDPFFTTKDRTGGTGLGLAIAYGTVQQAGGSITIESALGEGTTVTVLLPLRHGVAAVEPVQRPPAEVERGHGRILIAEDDAAVRRSTERMLTNAGYEATAAADGPSALKLLGGASEPFDLLLSDVLMPGMSGSVLAAEVRRVQPDIEILFMSGFADDATVLHDLASSRATCIPKPFTAAVLTAAIQQALNARRNAL